MSLNKQIHIYSIDTSYFHTEEENKIHADIQERKLINKLILKEQYQTKLEEVKSHNLVFEMDENYIEYQTLKKELANLYKTRKKYKGFGYNKKNSDNHNIYMENEFKIIQSRTRKNQLKKEVDNLDFINPRKTSEFQALDDNNKEISGLKKRLENKFKKNTRIKRVVNQGLKTRDMISIFDSNLTRTIGAKEDELTDDIIVVRTYYYNILENLIHNGFDYNNSRYICWSASAGQLRCKKAVFIKKSTLDKYHNSIYCGLTLKTINKPKKVELINGKKTVIEKGGCNKNKYLAYTSLVATASDKWDDFDIDKAIVVDDFETMVKGMVDYIDYEQYDENNLWKITRQDMEIKIPTIDGCGISLDYTGMYRLPWCKGLLVKFPFVSFIKKFRKIEKENNPDITTTQIGKVKDIYGKDYDILKDGIKYIFTKSQFKMWKYYTSWDDYKDNFKMYNCEACKCNEEDDNSNLAKISYQPLQSLYDMTDAEILELLDETNSDIENIGKDRQSILKVLGATGKNNKKNYFQQALQKYPELLNDVHSKEVLKETKASMVNNARYGKVRVDGKYVFIFPDVYAFAEWLFLHEEKPLGLLKDGEVSCSSKDFDDGIEIGMIRSPHLNFSHCINTNVVNETTKEWYKASGVYTSIHSLYSLELMCDWDGDTVMIYKNKVLIDVAKRIRKKHDIIPLYYELKKASDDIITRKTLYDGMISAYSGGNIGEVSNSICKVWNFGNIGEDELRAISYLTLWNNVVIDYAKTLWKPAKSDEMQEFLKQYTRKRLPYFFKYIPDKDKEEQKLEKINKSVVNRLTNLVSNPRRTFEATNCGSFDYTLMLKDKNVKSNSIIAKKIISDFTYWNRNKKYITNRDEDSKNNAKNNYIKKKCFLWTDDIEYVVDVLVKYYYFDSNSNNKRALWDIFGDIILARLNNNIDKNTLVCEVCGKRIKVSITKRNKYCEECAKIVKQEQINTLKREKRLIVE